MYSISNICNMYHCLRIISTLNPKQLSADWLYLIRGTKLPQNTKSQEKISYIRHLSRTEADPSSLVDATTKTSDP